MRFLVLQMDESDVREMVKNELDRILKEGKLVEGLAGRVADAIRPELAAMVSKFAQDLAAAIPAIPTIPAVPDQPPVPALMLTLDPSPAGPFATSAPLTFRSASTPMTPISPAVARTTVPAAVPASSSPPGLVPTAATSPDSILDPPVSPIEPVQQPLGQVPTPEPTPSVHDPQPPAVVADSTRAGPSAPVIDAVPDFGRASEPGPTPEAQVSQTEGGASKGDVLTVDAEVHGPVVPVEAPQAASGDEPAKDGERPEDIGVVTVGTSNVVEGTEAVAPFEEKDEGRVTEGPGTLLHLGVDLGVDSSFSFCALVRAGCNFYCGSSWSYPF